MLRVRQEHGVAALRGEVYVIGGYAMSPTTSVDAYNPTTRMWRSVASLPMPLQHPNIGVVRERLFIAGLLPGQGTASPQDNVYAYDPDRDRWDAKSPLPAGTGRAAGCVAIIGDKIYLFGGRARRRLRRPTRPSMTPPPTAGRRFPPCRCGASTAGRA